MAEALLTLLREGERTPLRFLRTARGSAAPEQVLSACRVPPHRRVHAPGRGGIDPAFQGTVHHMHPDHPLYPENDHWRGTGAELAKRWFLGRGVERFGSKTGTTEKEAGVPCSHADARHWLRHEAEGSCCSSACRRELKAAGRGHECPCYTSSIFAFGEDAQGRQVMTLVVVDEVTEFLCGATSAPRSQGPWPRGCSVVRLDCPRSPRTSRGRRRSPRRSGPRSPRGAARRAGRCQPRRCEDGQGLARGRAARGRARVRPRGRQGGEGAMSLQQLVRAHGGWLPVTEPRPRRRRPGSSWTHAGSCRATCSWRSRGPGTTGALTATDAVARGAVAIVAPRPSRGSQAARPSGSTTRRLTGDPRPGLRGGAGSRDLLAGVTGTNGKTSVRHLVAHLPRGRRSPRGGAGDRGHKLADGLRRPRTPRPTPRPWLSSWPRTALPGTRSPWR